MAGQVRHLKVKSGRFYARLAVPSALQQIIGKKELIVVLGGDRREAMKALPSAVAALQVQLKSAERQATASRLDSLTTQITTAEFGRTAALRYAAALIEDEHACGRHPSPDQIEAATDRAAKRTQSDSIDPSDALAMLDAVLGSGPIDYYLVRWFRRAEEALLMSNLFWLTDAQMARLEPFVGKTVPRTVF